MFIIILCFIMFIILCVIMFIIILCFIMFIILCVIMFIIILWQHVSILIESSSRPSKKIDPYLKCFKMHCWIPNAYILVY